MLLATVAWALIGMAVSTGASSAFVYWTPFPGDWALAIIVASGVIGAGAAAALFIGSRRRPRPERYVSTIDALNWMVDRSRWGRRLPPDQMEIIAAQQEFERAARHGLITVTGRRRHYTAFDLLPCTYWETAGLDLLRHLRDDHPDCRTEERASLIGYVEYHDLRVPERQVRRCWPAAILGRFPYRLRLERYPAHSA